MRVWQKSIEISNDKLVGGQISRCTCTTILKHLPKVAIILSIQSKVNQYVVALTGIVFVDTQSRQTYKF